MVPHCLNVIESGLKRVVKQMTAVARKRTYELSPPIVFIFSRLDLNANSSVTTLASVTAGPYIVGRTRRTFFSYDRYIQFHEYV